MNAWRSRTGVAIAAALIAGVSLCGRRQPDRRRPDRRADRQHLRARAGRVTGARAYIEGVNAAGGVGGRRIALVTLDDGGDATRAAENTRRLIERDGVVAMFGGVEGGPCVASLEGGVGPRCAADRLHGRIAGNARAVQPLQLSGARAAPCGVRAADRHRDDLWLRQGRVPARRFGHRAQAPRERAAAGRRAQAPGDSRSS